MVRNDEVRWPWPCSREAHCIVFLTINSLQTFMRKSAQTEQDVLPIVGQCLEGVQRCTDSINEKEVSLMMSSMTLHYDPPLPTQVILNVSIDCHFAVRSVKLAESDQYHVTFFSVTSQIFLYLQYFQLHPCHDFYPLSVSFWVLFTS